MIFERATLIDYFGESILVVKGSTYIVIGRFKITIIIICGPQGLSPIGCTYAPHNYIVAR